MEIFSTFEKKPSDTNFSAQLRLVATFNKYALPQLDYQQTQPYTNYEHTHFCHANVFERLSRRSYHNIDI